MIKFTKSIICLLLLFAFAEKSSAQMSGVYTVPGSFPDLATAISSLNTVGVSAGVTINISSGYSETAPVGGFILTASGTFANPIVFQKSGAGLNPVITASVGVATPASATQDGVISLIGSDYITFDGIDINDPNTTNPATMEYGIGFFKASTTNGCQNNTIKNCVITLNRINNVAGGGPASDGSRAINVVNTLRTSQTTNLAITSIAGSNSNNSFYSNTIQNCNIGIALIGFADVSPFTFADIGNDIGGNSGSFGNTIVNFGGAPAAARPSAAIQTLAQYNINVANNLINNNNGSGVNHPSTLRGIYLNTATSANASILSNTITLVGSTANIQMSAIENVSGATSAGNSININNNSIINCTNPSNTTGTFYGIYNNGVSCATLNIQSNFFNNIATNASTGSNYLIYNTGAVTSAITITNNVISNCTNSATTSGSYFGIINNANSSAILTISSNTISNCSASASTGGIYMFYNALATAGAVSITNNMVSSTTHSIISSGSIYGVFNNGVSSSLILNNNTFDNYNSKITTGSINLIYNTAAITNAVAMNNNVVSSSTNSMSTTGSYFAIYNNAATAGSLDMSNNTFTNCASFSGTGATHLIYNRGASTNTFNTISISNNGISNYTNTASGGAVFYNIYNNGPSSNTLSILSNSILNESWNATTSSAFLVINSGTVANAISVNNNGFSSLTFSNNTTGSFNGIYTTGNSAGILSLNNNTLTNNNLSSSSGAVNLIYNSGNMPLGINITNNLISTLNFSASTSGNFYGIYNGGTTASTINLTNNTFTSNALYTATGAANLIYNTGLVISSVSAINMNSNLFANNTSSISSNGSFYGIYNNAASCGDLTMSNNTFTNNSNYAANGGVYSVHNRGAFTNTFSTISINNNLVASQTNSATSNATFYNLFNSGVSSVNLSIASNSIINSIWQSQTATRYLIANTGSVSSNDILLTNNIFTGLTNTLNTTGTFYGIYTAGNANSNLNISGNQFINDSYFSTSGGTNLIYNAGIISNTVSIINNLFSNQTYSSTTSGIFYGLFNSGSTTSLVSLSNNTFANNIIVSSTGATNLIYNTGVVATTINTINMNNNLFANCSNTITSSGSYFALYNNGVSAQNLNMSNNTFTNSVYSFSNGAVVLVHNRGALTNTFVNISMTSNLFGNCTNAISSNGISYGIFNSGVTGLNLNLSNNTFNTINWSSTTAGRYLIYNTSVINVASTFTNNLFSNLSNTLNTTGGFYGIYNGAAPASSAVLSITNNTFVTNNLVGTTGPAQLITSTGIINNTITITNNLISSYSNSFTSSGYFYGIYNGSNSNANLSISNNTVANCVSSTSTGATYLFYNTGVVNNFIDFSTNSISNFTNSSATGAFVGIYNAGAGGNLSVGINTINNVNFSTTGSNRYIIYNIGSMSVTTTFTNNLISNLTNTLNTTGGFYGINNGAGGTTIGALTIDNNTFLNNSLAGTTGAVQVITSTGTINNTLTITNNLISNYTSSLSTSGLFYGIYSTSASNANLILNTNTITNCVSSTSTGVTYLIYNTGAVAGAILMKDNLVSSFTNSSSTGAFAGIYNAGASGNLDLSNNTFTNIPFYTTGSNRYILYNTGSMSVTNTFTNNIVSNLTNTLNTIGSFYGLYNGAGGTSLATTNISNNTFANNSLSATTGGIQILTNAGTINNTITITNNLISNYSGAISTTGSFYGIYNASASNANLIMDSNTFTNTSSQVFTGSSVLFYNTGAITNSIAVTNNLISSFTHSALSSGVFYGIYNSGVATGNLDISVNTFTNNFSTTTNGATYFIYNRGSLANIFNIIKIGDNLISNCTQSTSLGGNIHSIYNSGVLSSNLSINTNTVTNNNWATVASSRYLIYNTGQVTNTVSINDNLFTNLTATTNANGIFYGILNSSPNTGNLEIKNNILNNNFSTATTGNMHLIYNNGTILNTVAITNNLLSNCTNSASTSAPFYGIYNNSTNYSSLDIANNTFTNCFSTSSSGTSYMIYNLGTTSNTITNISIANNLISSFTHTSISGLFYGVLNNNVSSANLSVATNTFLNTTITTSTSARYFIYNTGSVSNSLSLADNSISNCTSTLNTTGSFYGVINTGASPGVSSITGNALNNISLVSTTGISYMVYNTGNLSNSNSITNNVISGVTHSSGTTGTFYGIYNGAVASNSISIAGNSINNANVATNTASAYLIYNTGIAANTVGSISINNNTLSTCSNTLNATGAFYGIFNNLISATNLNMDANTISNQIITSNNSIRYLIYNTGSVTTSASISNNLISNGNYTANTTAALYGIYNTAACPGGIAMSGNTFSNTISASTTGTTYLIYNNGVTSNSVSIDNNNVIGFTYSSANSGTFYGVYNNGSNSNGLSMSGNTFTNNSIQTNSISTYFVLCAGSPTILINTITLDNNQITTTTYSPNTSASFYGVFNNGIQSQDLSMNGNICSTNFLSTAGGTAYLIYNTGPTTNDIQIDNNQVLNNSIITNTSNPFYGIYNSGNSSSNLSLSSNSITNNFLDIITGDTYLIYNTGTAVNTITAANNVIASNSNSVATTGNFYGIFNSASATGLNASGNIFTNNSSKVVSGNTSLIYNSGAITDAIDLSNNNLAYSFNNTSSAYTGILSGIFNVGGTTTTTLNVSGNNFSNFNFQNVTGLGAIYFINNLNDNSDLTYSGNTWNNITINNSGAHYFMNNASNTQANLSVLNNSIVTGYTRSAASGLLYLFNSNGTNVPSTGIQTISGNNFSNITSLTSGIGNFNGIYCNDGGNSPYPRKLIFNNVLSNITYNSPPSNFIGLYADYLGDGGTASGSEIYNNTISNISFAGTIFGLYNGLNVSPNQSAKIYSNAINNFTSTSINSVIYSACISGGGNGLNFYKNKINDISQNGAAGIAHGIYVAGLSSVNIYNNYIGNIYTPSSSAPDALNGIHSISSGTINAYFNTVYLNGVSTGANFNSNAIYSAIASNLNLKNNIFINKSTANGSGISAAFKRSAPSLSNYSAGSNNNLFYAGVPSSNAVLFYDGTTVYPSISAFQNIVTPREANSVTEDTPFLSTIGSSPNFLHVNTVLPSLTESHGVNVAGITDDFDTQVRQGNAGYAGSGSAPDIGADEYDQNLPPCTSANAGTVSPASITRCAGETIALNSAGYTYTAAGGIIHQWRVSPTSGGPYNNIAGANNTGYSSNPNTSGNQYYVLVTTCTNNAQVSTSNEVTVTINPLPTSSISIVTSTICSGQNISLNGSTDIGTNFLWTGPNNFTSNIQNPTLSNASTNASGSYSLQVSIGTCSSTVNAPILVNPTPPAFSVTPQLASVCSGGSQTLNASAGISTPTLNFTTNINQNTPSSYPAPYSVYYGGQKMQFLVLATELTAAGFIGGTPITTLQFPVISLGANWGVGLAECQNFQINVGHTLLSSLTSFQTGLSNVLSPTNFTPVVGGNVHQFSAPFVWDGTSNIILESSFSNNIIGTLSNAVIQSNSPTGFLSTIVYRADNQSAATIAAATNSNVNIGVARPNFILNGLSVGSYSWNPSLSLSSSNTQSTIATPSSATVYSVELSNGSCFTQSTLSINVVQVPTVNIAATTTILCVGNAATLTATGANNYTWSTGSTNTAIVVSPASSTTYSIIGLNSPCPTTSSFISFSVNPAIVVNAVSSSPAVCAGQDATLTATGATSYTWSNGVNSNTVIVTPTVNTSYTVTGSSGAGCTAKKVISVISNSLPIILVNPTSQTICLGETVSFTASGANLFIWYPDNLSSSFFSAIPPITTNYTLVGQAANNCKDSVIVSAIVEPCTGIAKNNSSNTNIRVFPNPTKDKVSVEFDFGGRKEIWISNSVGALIQEISTTQMSEVVDLSQFAKGIYFVRVTTKESAMNFKIILE